MCRRIKQQNLGLWSAQHSA